MTVLDIFKTYFHVGNLPFPLPNYVFILVRVLSVFMVYTVCVYEYVYAMFPPPCYIVLLRCNESIEKTCIPLENEKLRNTKVFAIKLEFDHFCGKFLHPFMLSFVNNYFRIL